MRSLGVSRHCALYKPGVSVQIADGPGSCRQWTVRLKAASQLWVFACSSALGMQGEPSSSSSSSHSSQPSSHTMAALFSFGPSTAVQPGQSYIYVSGARGRGVRLSGAQHSIHQEGSSCGWLGACCKFLFRQTRLSVTRLSYCQTATGLSGKQGCRKLLSLDELANSVRATSPT